MTQKVLRFVEVKIIDCSKSDYESYEVDETMLCAGSEGLDSCQVGLFPIKSHNHGPVLI